MFKKSFLSIIFLLITYILLIIGVKFWIIKYKIDDDFILEKIRDKEVQTDKNIFLGKFQGFNIDLVFWKKIIKPFLKNIEYITLYWKINNTINYSVKIPKYIFQNDSNINLEITHTKGIAWYSLHYDIRDKVLVWEKNIKYNIKFSLD